ncbi:MAG: hypothetical protein LUC88_05720 [Prevotella sp.]|nr:hypothetical protein [Prevotella sp.]
MLTREEVGEIMTYCQDHGMSYKSRRRLTGRGSPPLNAVRSAGKSPIPSYSSLRGG